jgi:uncharacterized membrane protein
MTDRRLWLWSAGLGILGLGISVYLTLTHYFSDQVPLACATGGLVDCESVTSSAESMVGPFPVALLGVLWFAGFLLLVLVRAAVSDYRLLLLQVAWSVVGLVVVFYLVYAELFLIGAICLWCTAVHAIVVGVFLTSLWEATAPPPIEPAGRNGVTPHFTAADAEAHRVLTRGGPGPS